MSVQEPLRFRKVLLAGVIALALTGTGVAIAWSATDTPSPSASAPGQSDKAPGQGKSDKAQRPQHLHSESVVKKADGSFETVLTQQGTVDAVSETSVTVKSEDGFTQTYAVNADTKIIKFPAPAADGSPATGDDGKRLKRSEVTIADIATGDTVRVSGVKSGNNAEARHIVEGAGTGPGHGKGLGKGHGHGLGKGLGHAKRLSPK
ncbi:hypothetical protein QK290_02640 [Pseudarthrobacter sp. AL07]|uniref:hypothetical protein n=1 Tax=unclassified Pseudarthrobacter TaxID=2647000 RepID=UPI00249ADACA|nr:MULTISPECIES: hypothetical protein [unclassified Pseudarthrobacter]MDI3193373.1 hypothetical protein [Pseudarthrobacter sp. AL20]MDI3207441.1 hypothetical protein [Pseudarthrobacter sp. AL07]